MGMSLIKSVWCLILFLGAAVFILGVEVKKWHVGQFSELGRARRTTLRFAKAPHIAFYFLFRLSLSL